MSNPKRLDTFVRDRFSSQARHRGLCQPRLLDRLGIAANFGQSIMAADRRNLVNRTAGFGEAAALCLAQAVRTAMR